ncbi:MAG TPA: hypothetical protein VII98_07860 [Solirubrobacteraceae bacterium]
MPGGLERVAQALDGDGGLLSQALLADGPQLAADDPQLGARSASGPRAAGSELEIATVVEAAYEGHLLHLGRSRILSTEDLDLALLAGDRLYALGLAGLAGIGDVDAVRELADVIALCALARAQDAPELADAAWEAGAAAIGWGSGPALEAAKVAARRGEPGAAEALRAAARQLSGDVAPAR